MVSVTMLVAKHTQSLKQRAMYEIVRMMRTSGITIGELTTYEASHSETVNVVQQVRKQMKLSALARQAKDAGVIKATANSLYTRSGAKAAAEYLEKVGETDNLAEVFDNSSRAQNVAAYLATYQKPAPDRSSPQQLKASIVKKVSAPKQESTPTPTQASAPLPPLDEILGDEAQPRTRRATRRSTKKEEE